MEYVDPSPIFQPGEWFIGADTPAMTCKYDLYVFFSGEASSNVRLTIRHSKQHGYGFICGKTFDPRFIPTPGTKGRNGQWCLVRQGGPQPSNGLNVPIPLTGHGIKIDLDAQNTWELHALPDPMDQFSFLSLTQDNSVILQTDDSHERRGRIHFQWIPPRLPPR